MDESNSLEEIKTWEHPPRYGSDQFKEKVAIQGESHLDFLGESGGSLAPPHDSFPDAGEAINDFWSMCLETSCNDITLNLESNFTRREKNHSLFHWNTMMFPEILIRIWMSSKRNASMIIGISMDQETCLIHGQVSLSLLYWKKTSKRIYVVQGEINEKTADIQATSFMARSLDKIWKESPAEGEAQMVNEKPKLDDARRLRGICVLDPEDKEFKETIKKARKKLETPMALAILCKISKNMKNCGTCGKSNEIKSKLACILEASESTRLRMGESLPNHHVIALLCYLRVSTTGSLCQKECSLLSLAQFPVSRVTW